MINIGTTSSKKIVTSTGTRNQFTGVEIEGLDELCEAFAKLGEDAILKLSEPSDKGAQIVCDRAKSKINDVTGDLRDSLTVKKAGRQANKKAYRIFAQVTFGKGGMHGVPLELGHKLKVKGKTIGTVKEKPFLRPAADETKEQIANLMATAMNDVIEKMGGKK